MMSRTVRRAALLGTASGIVIFLGYLLARKSGEPSTSTTVVPMRVALIGDSLAVGLAPHLQKLVTQSDSGMLARFRYEAKAGTTVKQWVDNRWADWLEAYAPTLIIVVLGTNDLGYSPAPPRGPYEQFRDRLRATGARIVWVQPPIMPAHPMIGVRALIESLGVDVVPAATVPLSSDGVHPSSYSGWAQQIWQAIRS